MSGMKRRLPREQCEHFASILRGLVEAEFAGVQAHAAKALGWSCAHMSNLLQGEPARGPGMHCLIAVRNYTGLSIDALLGLPPPKRP